VMDHFYQIGVIGPPEEPMLESYSALSYAAAVTSRIKLGTMVTGVAYRYPGILVKQVTTLDVLSGGRAYLGIGAGWFEREHLDLGAPYPPVAKRFERLEETLQVALQMWSGEIKPFTGMHFQLPEPICRPLPLSKPHPPILIGGGGERKTLRLVAKYADACNLFPSPELPRKLEVLKAHCEAEGRPYEAIEKTVLLNLNIGTSIGVDAAIDQLGEFASMGFDQVIVGLPNVSEPGVIEGVAKRAAQKVEELSLAD
jgi:F420-dependent oxidoreductase-like protein